MEKHTFAEIKEAMRKLRETGEPASENLRVSSETATAVAESQVVKAQAARSGTRNAGS